MTDKTPMDIVHDFRSLAEENERQGNQTAAAVYRDAANHVKEELTNE
jgi:hypothetical protein